MSFLSKLNPTSSNSVVPHLSSTRSSASTHSIQSKQSNGVNSSHSINTASNSGTTNSHSKHPFELSILLESPPVVLYGPPNESSGSLISGQLSIDITEDSFSQLTSVNSRSSLSLAPTLSKTKSKTKLTTVKSNSSSSLTALSSNNSTISPPKTVLINSVQLSLVQKITYAKPFLPPSNTLANCSSCKKKSVELARWDIMTQPHNLPIGKHSYPFSHLLPGMVPPTTTLGTAATTSISYELVAIASYNNHSNLQTLVKVILPLNVSRSILRGPDKNSLRVFPPTEVTANAVLPNVIYPRSTFAIELKLKGVSSKNKRWRMRRVSWRIEEVTKVKANACINHKTKLKVVQSHIQKSQALTKPVQQKRNQQSGPTTSVSVSNSPRPSPGLLPSITPSQSATQLAPSMTANSLQPTESEDRIDHPNPDLHPSDHANQESQESSAASAAPQPKGELELYNEEIRTISSGEIRSGWKSDFSGEGTIELVSDLSCSNLATAATSHETFASSNQNKKYGTVFSNVSCDIDDSVLGISVGHVLVVEVVVSEEILTSPSVSNDNNDLSTSASHGNNDNLKKADQRLAELSPIFANHVKPTKTEPTPASSSSANNPSPALVGVPTGAARVLRMQFKLILTERSGLGIAWDDEVPPTYDDVSALSPPNYDAALVNTTLKQVGENPPPLYPLNQVPPAHTHSHHNGSGANSSAATPNVVYGIGDTPSILPRGSSHYQSINGTLDLDELTLN